MSRRRARGVLLLPTWIHTLNTTDIKVVDKGAVSISRSSIKASVSVVVPVYGCEGCLEELVERVSRVLAQDQREFEIILVDDQSPDEAWLRIVELAHTYRHVRGLRLSRNFGQHAAICAGLSYIRHNVAIVMDCDLQDVPEEIPALLASLKPGVEVVLGKRVVRRDAWLKRVSSQLFYRLLGWLTDTRYDATTANFGAYSRKVIESVCNMKEQDLFFPLLVRWTGFNAARVAVTHGRRIEGKSSYSLRKLLALAVRVALSFSDKPLRLVVNGALILALLSVAIGGFAIDQYFVGNVRVAGFTSLIASLWFTASAVMFCLGILGLYVGRLHAEVKGRPRYIVWQDTRSAVDRSAQVS